MAGLLGEGHMVSSEPFWEAIALWAVFLGPEVGPYSGVTMASGPPQICRGVQPARVD